MPSYLVIGASCGIGPAFANSMQPMALIERHPAKCSLRRGPEHRVFKAPPAPTFRSNIHAVKLDMKWLESAAVEVAKVTGGTLDVLIINSGITNPGKLFKDYTHEELVKRQNTFETNVCTIKAFPPKGKQKKVIAISSGNADIDCTLTIGAGMGMTYKATKAALNAYISRLLDQYRKSGVIFCSICPGIVDVGATQEPPVTDDAAMYAPMVKQLKPLYPDLGGLSTPSKAWIRCSKWSIALPPPTQELLFPTRNGS